MADRAVIDLPNFFFGQVGHDDCDQSRQSLSISLMSIYAVIKTQIIF